MEFLNILLVSTLDEVISSIDIVLADGVGVFSYVSYTALHKSRGA